MPYQCPAAHMNGVCSGFEPSVLGAGRNLRLMEASPKSQFEARWPTTSPVERGHPASIFQPRGRCAG